MTAAAGSPVARLVAQAEAQAARRDWAQAIAAYQAALKLAPDDPYVLVQLSYMHSLAGHYRHAEHCALAAARTGTTDPRVLAELLPRLRTFNQGPVLLACIQRALPMSRMPIPLLIGVAAQLSYMNLPERAIAFLDEARRADPDYPTTLLARAQVLTYLGRFEEAAQDVQRALARAPEIAQGYWLQAPLRRQTTQANHVQAIRRELARPGRRPGDVASLAFALHKELDDLGQHEGAWEALMHGCRAKRSTLDYSTAATARLFDALMHHAPAAGTAPARDASPPADAPTPVFIVGMHRSGTTLLEQLLDGHRQVRGIGELYDFTSAMRHATDHHCKGVIDETLVQRAAHADLPAAGERYVQGVRWRLQGQAFFTDKLPSNFLNIGFICEALPQAKILHMVRDPVETCFSNLRELFSDANGYSYDLAELADYHLLYQRLMRHWHARYPGRVLDVEYARLTREPEAQLRRVAEFCGFGFEAGMLAMDSRRGVVTASAVQVRDRITVQDTPKWAPYAPWLRPLVERLRGG